MSVDTMERPKGVHYDWDCPYDWRVFAKEKDGHLTLVEHTESGCISLGWGGNIGKDPTDVMDPAVADIVFRHAAGDKVELPGNFKSAGSAPFSYRLHLVLDTGEGGPKPYYRIGCCRPRIRDLQALVREHIGWV